jgi:Co/Zn/Cd efflux system component
LLKTYRLFNGDKYHYLFLGFLHKISIQTMSLHPTNRLFLTRYAWLSIGAAVITISLKTTAYLLTGSIGLLSDALESVVNLVGALMALAMLTIAARPADEDQLMDTAKPNIF